MGFSNSLEFVELPRGEARADRQDFLTKKKLHVSTELELVHHTLSPDIR